MNLVRENINFERGNPEKSLEIGKYSLVGKRQYLKSLQEKGVKMKAVSSYSKGERNIDNIAEFILEFEDLISKLVEAGCEYQDMNIDLGPYMNKPDLEVQGYEVAELNFLRKKDARTFQELYKTLVVKEKWRGKTYGNVKKKNIRFKIDEKTDWNNMINLDNLIGGS